MPGSPKRADRAPGWRRLAGVEPLALGLSLVGVSLALGRSAAVPVSGALMPVGGGLVALGVLALLRGAMRRQRAAPPVPLHESPPAGFAPHAPPSQDGRPVSSGPLAGGPPEAPDADARRADAFPPSPAVPAAMPAPARLHEWSAEVFGLIEWRRFESVVEALFRQVGFEVRAQPHDAVGGTDLWLFSPADPGAPVSVVRCRSTLDRRVGVGRLRELRGVMAARNVDRGQFVCASRFTPEAEAFAQENGIHLIDGDRLLGLIARRTPAQRRALLDLAFAGEWWRPTCPACGDRMTERTAGKRGRPFWGCTGFPRCRGTLPMRGR